MRVRWLVAGKFLCASRGWRAGETPETQTAALWGLGAVGSPSLGASKPPNQQGGIMGRRACPTALRFRPRLESSDC